MPQMSDRLNKNVTAAFNAARSGAVPFGAIVLALGFWAKLHEYRETLGWRLVACTAAAVSVGWAFYVWTAKQPSSLAADVRVRKFDATFQYVALGTCSIACFVAIVSFVTTPKKTLPEVSIRTVRFTDWQTVDVVVQNESSQPIVLDKAVLHVKRAWKIQPGDWQGTYKSAFYPSETYNTTLFYQTERQVTSVALHQKLPANEFDRFLIVIHGEYPNAVKPLVPDLDRFEADIESAKTDEEIQRVTEAFIELKREWRDQFHFWVIQFDIKIFFDSERFVTIPNVTWFSANPSDIQEWPSMAGLNREVLDQVAQSMETPSPTLKSVIQQNTKQLRFSTD